jgi:broad specificity phosphatase PhoE
VELILIRHARPDRVDPGSGAPADPGLSAEGWRQAECLASWLATERIDALYVSPMVRARETANPLERLLGTRATVREELAEWDRGRDYYVPMEEQKTSGHPDWQALVDRDWTAMPVDVFAFRDTVVDAVGRIAADHRGQVVAVVCHGGVINVYLSAVLGLADPLFFEPDYSGFSRVLVSSGGQRGIRSVNETPHLRD